ncbi:hypothetical protein [Arthrobacter sp. MAHUQ-56]
MTMNGSRVGVATRLPSYRAAIAELSRSATLVEEARGAVAVVPGVGDWWQVLLSARDQGAAAVVLAEPEMLPRELFDGGSGPGTWPADIPVVVERPRLRPDLVWEAARARQGTRARIVTVECAATAAALDDVIRDGLGWVRSLVQGPLTLVAGSCAGQARMALLDARAADGTSIPATLVGTVLDGPGAGGFLQVLALGEVRTELVLDQAAGLVRLETWTAGETLGAPQHYESSARLTLRRTLEALSSGQPVPDLEDLLQDIRLARELLEPPKTEIDVETRQSFVAFRPKCR